MRQIFNDIDFIDDDDIHFNRIFCEFTLENTFYRKDSKFQSYQNLNKLKIESQKIPVYSFRY
jgi:hypothetical protein